MEALAKVLLFIIWPVVIVVILSIAVVILTLSWFYIPFYQVKYDKHGKIVMFNNRNRSGGKYISNKYYNMFNNKVK